MLRHALLMFYNTADVKRWIDSVMSEQGEELRNIKFDVALPRPRTRNLV
jgi:hypothetical protein